MYDDGRYSRKKELDDFWNIDMITPRKITPKPSAAPAKSHSVDTVEITVSSVLETIADDGVFKSEKLSSAESGVIKKYISESDMPGAVPKLEPDIEYAPENSLVRKVRIYKKRSGYAYYENFCREALRSLSVEVEDAEPESFFSYVPQYDQLSAKQKQYYFYFRSSARKGIYIDIDYSYILLYIYEILNLGDKMDTAMGQSQLCGLWRAYKSKHPVIERSLLDWICEYSLIHRLPPPSDIGIRNIPSVCIYKEFLLVNRGIGYDYYAEALLALSCAYDFRKSKFAAGENLPLFEKYIPAALSKCVEYLSSGDGVLVNVGFNDSSIVRDAYVGALCSHRAKYRIELDFCSFSKTNDLRYLVGDIVKYAENKIRAYLGVKSKLSCYSLDVDIMKIIDEFFEQNLPRVRRYTPKEKKQEYDILYDLPAKKLSVSDAAKIEEESWNTTKSLVEAFEDTSEISVDDAPIDILPKISDSEVAEIPSWDEADELRSALGELYGFALAVLKRDTLEQRRLASELKKLPDSIVDSINEISADTVGDILIEDDGSGYRIVEDYEFYFDNSEG